MIGLAFFDRDWRCGITAEASKNLQSFVVKMPTKPWAHACDTESNVIEFICSMTIVSSMRGGKRPASFGCIASPNAAVTLHVVGLMLRSFDLSPVPDVDAPLSMMILSVSCCMERILCSGRFTVSKFIPDFGDLSWWTLGDLVLAGDLERAGESLGCTSNGDVAGTGDASAGVDVSSAVGVGVDTSIGDDIELILLRGDLSLMSWMLLFFLGDTLTSLLLPEDEEVLLEANSMDERFCDVRLSGSCRENFLPGVLL